MQWLLKLIVSRVCVPGITHHNPAGRAGGNERSGLGGSDGIWWCCVTKYNEFGVSFLNLGQKTHTVSASVLTHEFGNVVLPSEDRTTASTLGLSEYLKNTNSFL